MKTNKRNTKKRRDNRRTEVIAVLLLALVIIAILGEFGLTMMFGHFLVLFFNYVFGLVRFPIYLFLLYGGYRLFSAHAFITIDVKYFGFLLATVAAAVLLMIPSYLHAKTLWSVISLFHAHIGLETVHTFYAGGGIIGVMFYGVLKQYTGLAGTLIIAIITLLTGMALFLQKTLYEMLYPPIELTKTSAANIRQSFVDYQKRKIADAQVYDDEEAYDDLQGAEGLDVAEGQLGDSPERLNGESTHGEAIDEHSIASEAIDAPDWSKDWRTDTATVPADMKETMMRENASLFPAAGQTKTYRIPGLHFLHRPQATDTAIGQMDQQKQMKVLQETLDNFKIKATVTSVQVGPAITQYEVALAPGVKVSRILNLATDIALALAVKDVRIEAPIPGKSAVGIEVPNEDTRLVGLYEVLHKGNENKTKKLLVGLGRTINGREVQIEIDKMPHLLVAGATGSGKSVCINAIILSILLRATPDEVKFLMIDPKQVELNVYNGIPHLLAPVVTNPKNAAVALNKVVKIMEERYELFADAFVRNMEAYNTYAMQHDLETLPYIVVIIDELADLMVVAAKQVEESIMRLAQMARAAGIHLIVATQRPSVDVITGVIKSNIPSRIAFAVSSQVDSRTILDIGGAEKLVGRGDMLYLPAGENKPIRVQGAYISEKEIEKIVNFVKNQQESHYDTTLLEVVNHAVDERNNNLWGLGEDPDDELFRKALTFVLSQERVSKNTIKKYFSISFDRAARVVEKMVEQGILGPDEGNKGRRVLIHDMAELGAEANIASEDAPMQEQG